MSRYSGTHRMFLMLPWVVRKCTVVAFDWKNWFRGVLLNIIDCYKPTGGSNCNKIAAGLVPGQLTDAYLGHGCAFMFVYGFLYFKPVLFFSAKLNYLDGFTFYEKNTLFSTCQKETIVIVPVHGGDCARHAEALDAWHYKKWIFTVIIKIKTGQYYKNQFLRLN